MEPDLRMVRAWGNGRDRRGTGPGTGARPIAPGRSWPAGPRRGRLFRGKIPVKLVALTLLGIGAGSCGQKFDLPPQPAAGRIPSPGRYNLDKVWNLSAPTDLVCQGSYLYVIEDSSRISAYLTRAQQAIHPQFVSEFTGLIRPVRLALARRDSTFILVADAGDSTVKRYLFTGGAPLFTFTDPRWHGAFTGLAADNALNVYLTFAGRDTILKYDRLGQRARPVANNAQRGGLINTPAGMHWYGSALLVADQGTSLVLRVRGDTTNVAAGSAIGSPFLAQPAGAVSDAAAEFVYVADTGHNRILKFLLTGALVDSVYTPSQTETHLPLPLQQPRYLAVQDSLVFVSDPNNNRLVAFRLASQ